MYINLNKKEVLATEMFLDNYSDLTLDGRFNRKQLEQLNSLMNIFNELARTAEDTDFELSTVYGCIIARSNKDDEAILQIGITKPTVIFLSKMFDYYNDGNEEIYLNIIGMNREELFALFDKFKEVN